MRARTLNQSGRAGEAEGGAELILKEALEGEVEFDGAVGEEDEGGWGDGGLGHIEDAHAAGHGDGGALEVEFADEAVHLSGGDALAALAGDEGNLLEEAADVPGIALGVEGGEKNDGGVVEEFQGAAEALFVGLDVGGGLAVGAGGADEVPLIDER